MLISEIKKYIQLEKSVSITDLLVYFDLEKEELEIPLEILCKKGYIEPAKPIPVNGQTSKCGGCPMGCSPKAQENCTPTPNFLIYNWIKS